MLGRLRYRLGLDIPAVRRGALIVGLLVAATVFVFSGLSWSLVTPGGETVRAVFADTSQLIKGWPVRIDGVEHGTVKDITVNPGGRSATVEMEVDDEGMPLYEDATAAIRYRTLLGGTLVVDLDRGTPGAGELGSEPIPQSRTTNQVELDQVVGAIRRPERAGFKSMLAELARALRDPEAPARALETLADASPSLAGGVGSLRGRRDGDLRRLISHTSETVRALDQPTDVRDFVEGGATMLAATSRREAELRSTIDLSARVMPEIERTGERLDTTLGIADSLIADLNGPAADVAPAVAKLRPVVSDLDSLLGEARPLLSSLRPAASGLARTASEGVPLLRELQPSLRRLDERIFPDLAIRSPVTGRSTYEMIGPAVSGLQGSFAPFDDVGHFVRFPASGSDRVYKGPCAPHFADPGGFGEEPALIQCQELSDAIEQYFGYQPLPPEAKR